jgi:hypothetical protein
MQEEIRVAGLKLTTAELDEEVDKAKDFTPPLQAFYLVTALIRNPRWVLPSQRERALFQLERDPRSGCQRAGPGWGGSIQGLEHQQPMECTCHVDQ